MNTAEKLTTIAENEPKVFAAGQAEEKAAWWKMIMSRTSYNYLFFGADLSELGLDPPEPLSKANMQYMFAGAKGIKKLTKNQIDTSISTYLSNCFAEADLEEIEEVSFEGASSAQRLFSNCYYLHTIGKLILPDDGGSIKNTFSAFEGCEALRNITVEGKTAYPLNFQWSPLLSKASIISLVNALLETVEGYTLTLSLAAVNTAFETSEGAADGSTSEEWLALVATKPNWIISLV